MIIAVTLDGWSAFSREKSRRLSSIVHRVLASLDDIEYRHLGLQSHFIWSNTRKAVRFIRLERNNRPENVLFLSGKSLGAWNVWDRIIRVGSGGLDYSKTYAVTIDPCRPLFGDLTPNLNNYELQISGHVDKAVNIIAKVKGHGPAGARIICRNTQNVELYCVNHESIVDHPAVVGCITLLLKEEWPFSDD